MVASGGRAYDRQAVRLPRFQPTTVRKFALATVVAYGLLVVSGGAVRLTGSGLGCPDWPSCFQHHFTATLSFHPLVEDVNRFITVAVSVLSIATFAVTALRQPRRRDLTWLGSGLIAGLVAEIVLGGLVVLFKLNPYLVAIHFLLALVVLTDAVALYHLSGCETTSRENVVGKDLVHLARWQMRTLSLVIVLGTVVTGSGPHAGGPGAKRMPFALHDIAEVHSTVALFLIGLTVASQFAFHNAKAPELVLRRGRLMLEVMVVQGALGYTQYFLHDAAGVVELHLAGLTTLWIASLGFYLSLHRHTPGAAAPSAAAEGAAALQTAAGT